MSVAGSQAPSRAGGAVPGAVEVRNAQSRVRVDRGRLGRLAAHALRDLGLPGAEVGVLLVGERRIRELNRRWRGLDRPTDVLAFSQREGGAVAPGSALLGDVVIAPAVAARQAREAGHGTVAELELLLVHGLLHLAGYEHEGDPAGGRRMGRRSARILRGFRGAPGGRRGRA